MNIELIRMLRKEKEYYWDLLGRELIVLIISVEDISGVVVWFIGRFFFLRIFFRR